MSLVSGATLAVPDEYYVPKPGEIFSYKDVTPRIWEPTESNKALDPMNDLMESMRVNRAKALKNPYAPQRFDGENSVAVEFKSSAQPWQALEEVFTFDWPTVNTHSPQELAQLKKALQVKTVLDHPDIKIIELALGPGAVLPRFTDAAPGAFHILEGSAEILVGDRTIRAFSGTSVKLNSLVERGMKVTSEAPLKLLWFRWAPGGQQVYLDYGYYLTGSNFHAQPLESVMPANYEHWPEGARNRYEEINMPLWAAKQSVGGQQREQLDAYPDSPVFSNELDVPWLDFENIPAEGFFWAKDASKAGYALKAWNKMVRMKGIFQARVPDSQYDFNISYIAVGPKGKYITHSHATPEFYYILGGETEWIVEQQRYIAKAGNMYVHSPYMDHEMRGLKEGVPEVVLTGSWAPFGDRSVFDVPMSLAGALPVQTESTAIGKGFDFHDFKLKKNLKFQEK